MVIEIWTVPGHRHRPDAPFGTIYFLPRYDSSTYPGKTTPMSVRFGFYYDPIVIPK